MIRTINLFTKAVLDTPTSWLDKFSSVWLVAVWLLAARSGSPEAVLQARTQAGFLALAAASFSIFLVRRRRLHQLRPWR